MPREKLAPVLKASVHDIRFFATLLRGVQFANRATIIIYKSGLSIKVEEARTLLGTAFIFADIFDDYKFIPPALEPGLSLERSSPSVPQQRRRVKPSVRRGQEMIDGESSLSTLESESDDENQQWKDQDYEDENDNAITEVEADHPAFEIQLNTLVECLNIFGTAKPSAGNIKSSSTNDSGRRGKGVATKTRPWLKRDDNNNTGTDNNESADDGSGSRDLKGLDAYFGTGSEKKTSMRLSYAGEGHPLTLVITEDATTGPTTTCELTTYEPEPSLELDLDTSRIVLRIILNSSWLRDALSEIDSSCEKVTFIGNPTNIQLDDGHEHLNPRQRRERVHRATFGKAMFRILSDGTFGSTEMDYPNDKDVLETFECGSSVSFTYRFSHISKTMKALSSSTKTSLRIDEDGLLSLQFLMPIPKRPGASEEQRSGYIEFRCIALDED